ncbi:MAG TPA: BTAD domain-containing putative transcriptional regulator [Capsulimonadaceae bacterium]|jgi:predicted ATPase/DNA-binding SARP family transcriptional activator
MTIQEPDATTPESYFNLLGGFDVQIAGKPMGRLRSRKGQVLLALLIARAGKPVDRSWLAGSLWPDSDEAQALASVRQTLSDLRHALGECASLIESPSTRTLQFRASDVAVDVIRFDAAIARGDADSAAEAVRLYRGPLLDGSSDEAIWPDRQVREASYLNALELAAAARAEERDVAAAIDLYRRLTVADPYRESAYQALMKLLALKGDYPEAYVLYRDLRTRLSEDLRAQPSPATVAIYDEVRRAAKKRLDPGAPIEDASVDRSNHTVERIVDLPSTLSSLIGRERDITAIKVRLEAARVVTLIGFGGAGKTHLAIQTARELVERYRDGVRFVDLSGVTDNQTLAAAVAASVGFEDDPALLGSGSGFHQVKRGQFLVVLDNCEQVLSDAANVTARLLRAYPSARVLATSRQALGLAGEVVYKVAPLSVPSLAWSGSPDRPIAPDLAPALIASDSVRLFLARAAEVSPGFSLTSDNAASVATICRELEGLPLAIELAASRTNMMSVQEIAKRARTSYSHLGTGRQGMPARHKSIRAAIEWSYALLTDTERIVLARLGLFEDGWTLDAAEAICGIAGVKPGDMLDILGRLVDASLVTVTWNAGDRARYRLLRIIKQYALDTLIEHDDDIEKLRAEFVRFYLQLAIDNAPATTLPQIDHIEADLGNIVAAITQRIESEQSSLTAIRAAVATAPFWHVRGKVNAAVALMTGVVEAANAEAVGDDLVAQSLLLLARLEIMAGNNSQAAAHLELLGHESVDADLVTVVAAQLALVQGSVQLARDLAAQITAEAPDWVCASRERIVAYADAADGRTAEALARIAGLTGTVMGGTDELETATTLAAYGRIAAFAGADLMIAERTFTAALAIADEWSAVPVAIAAFEGMAKVSVAMGKLDKAALIIEAASLLRQTHGVGAWILIDPRDLKAEIRQKLDAKRYAAQAQRARSLSLLDAIEAATA